VKLFSWSGALPLVAFLVEHAYTNSRALGGQAPFASTIARLRAIPLVSLLEVLFILLPLAFHLGYGTYLVVTRKPLRKEALLPRPLALVNRGAAMVAVVYVLYHLYEYRLSLTASGVPAEQFHTALTSNLSAVRAGVPLKAIFYAVGTAAVVGHLAIGLWTFLASRFLASSRARLFGAVGSAAFGVVMFAVLLNVVVYFATGSRILGSSEPPLLPLETAPCP
jgi:succinate dehydrogenase / fumarate reductase cytochrome b subunit